MIGDRIKALRLVGNLSREDLANKLGVSYSAIAMYEQGNREPNNDLLVKISNFFNVSTDYLLEVNLNSIVKNNQNKLEQILQLANGLTIQETNYLIKQLNNAKIQIEKGE